MMKIFHNHLATLHQPQNEVHHGQLVPSFENQARLQHISECLQARGFSLTQAKDFGLEPIGKVHHSEYLNFLSTIWSAWQASGEQADIIPYIWPAPGLNRPNHHNLNAKVGSFAFSSDTAITKGTWQAAYQGAQCALSAVDAILQGDTCAFALTRPPGHHAHAGLYGGYCFLNNAAIAAQAARSWGYQRVAILDIDFHHGNGTQDIFYQRNDVLTISIHGTPKSNFPYFLGFADEQGANQGMGFNLNLPLENGATFATWCSAFATAKAQINQFNADFLVVPLGVDTYEHDPISSFKLQSDDFSTIGAMLAQLQLPTILVMEGGYDIAPLGENVANVISAFQDEH